MIIAIRFGINYGIVVDCTPQSAPAVLNVPCVLVVAGYCLKVESVSIQ